MISPSELGLPYTSWRPRQAEVIQQIAATHKRIIIIEAPTGSGKSALALGLLRYTNKRGVILTSTKTLQEQYAKEGGKLVKTIMGRHNYDCVMPTEDPTEAFRLKVEPHTPVDEAPCSAEYECKLRTVCTFFVKRREAEASPISVHNYAFWLPEANYHRSFTTDWIIADEGHLLDQTISEFAAVELSRQRLKMAEDFEVEVPTKALDKPETWINFGKLVTPQLLMEVWKHEKGTKQRARWLKHFNAFKDLGVLVPGDDRYVVRQEETGIIIQPVWSPPFTKYLLHRPEQKLVIMSATILDREAYCRYAGFDEDEVEYIELPWTFHEDNRPIHYRPVGAVTRDNMTKVIPRLAMVSDFILDSRPDEKGVIHSGSYQIARDLHPLLKNRGRVLWHQNGLERRGVVERYKNDTTNLCLLSPSVGTGEDFKYDLARFQIILKVPWPYMGDPVIRIRMHHDPDWYNYKTVQELLQMFGRVMRAEDDSGLTIILDETFERLFEKARKFFPDAVVVAIHWD